MKAQRTKWALKLLSLVLTFQGCTNSYQAIQLAASSQVPADVVQDFSASEWQELQKLSPAPQLPKPPVDVTNRFADNPNAAKLGQELFFDPGFSGPLLESDNDGFHDGAGLQGETGRVSCASCHVPASGFSDTRTIHKQLSLASGWTFRRTPSILDVGHAKLLMWDGRFDSLQRQVLAVFESPMEGNSSRLYFAQDIARRYARPYQDLFGKDPTVVLGSSYPQLAPQDSGCKMILNSTTTPTDDCADGTRNGVPGAADYESLSPDQKNQVTEIVLNVGKAIAAYERLLSCGTGRFDAYMHGDRSALSESEIRGAKLFVGKAKCADCHSGPFFSDQKFHNVGMFPAIVSAAFVRKNDEGAEKGLAQVVADPLNSQSPFSDGHDGRLPTTPATKMLGAFRTPMLRCSSQRPSFMRTGQFRTLEQVVEFFNKGGHKQPGVPAPAIIGHLGETELTPLGLTDEEVADVVAFIKSLDGPGPAPELLKDPFE
ncbi:MAG: cytochrome-c peroxidase [Bdellovibrionales bacterium]